MRNLSRKSLIPDAQLSQAEENLFAQAICKNMNENHFISSWKNVIQLSSGQLLDGYVECEVKSGMTLVAQSDYTTHVAVTYVLVFNLSEQLKYPFEFTLQSQPTATDSSLAQHAEMHPIDVTAHSSKSTTVYWSPWWIVQGELPIELEEIVESEPSFIGKVIDGFVNYPILIVPVAALIIAAILVFIRKQNSIELDFEEDEAHEIGEVSEDEEEESSGSEYDEIKEEKSTEVVHFDQTELPRTDVQINSKQEDENPDNTPRTGRNNPYGAGPIKKVKKQANAESQVTDSRKGRNNPYGEPVTKVKRRRLDKGNATQSPAVKTRKTSKRKVVSPKSTGEVKTRRVVTYSNTDDSNGPGDES